VLGLFMGFAYYRMGTDSTWITTRVGFMYISMMILVATPANMGLAFWFSHRRVIYREAHGAGMYSPVIYGLSQAVTDIPPLLVCVTLFMTLSFWTARLGDGADTFFELYFFYFLALMFSSSWAFLLVCACNTLSSAQMLFGALLPLASVFSGFVIRRTQIPHIWIWLYYANPFRWLLEPLVISELKWIGEIPCPSPDPTWTVTCQYESGRAAIESIGFFYGMLWPDAAIFIGFIVIVRLATLAVLQFKKPPGT